MQRISYLNSWLAQPCASTKQWTESLIAPSQVANDLSSFKIRLWCFTKVSLPSCAHGQLCSLIAPSQHILGFDTVIIPCRAQVCKAHDCLGLSRSSIMWRQRINESTTDDVHQTAHSPSHRKPTVELLVIPGSRDENSKYMLRSQLFVSQDIVFNI